MFRLRVLGEVTLLDGEGRPVDAVLNQPKRFALLIFLATHVGRHHHRREAVLSVFWPDGDEHQGRNALRQSLHFLRSYLGDDSILSGGDGLSINESVLSCDVRDFESRVATSRFTEALTFYDGSFMEGFPSPSEAGLGCWIEEQRAWLQEIATRCAWTAAVQAEAEGDPFSASMWWRRASELSPYDEAIAQRHIASLVALGNRGRAVDALRAFASRLQRDLEIEPSPETIEAVRTCLTPAGGAANGSRPSWNRSTSRGGRSDPFLGHSFSHG